MKEYWQEIRALTMRWVRRLSREKFSMLFTLVQPMLFWLIFFGNLFQRAADLQVTQSSSYISFLTAGVVVMTVLNNGLAGGVPDGVRKSRMLQRGIWVNSRYRSSTAIRSKL